MTGDVPPRISIEVATDEDHVAVSRVLDGALLEQPDLQERIAAGTVLVARGDRAIVGAVVVDTSGTEDRSPPAAWPASSYVEAVAVRRKRRRSGIGAALLRSARRRWGPLTAAFDERVKPFYESLGAECQRADVEQDEVGNEEREEDEVGEENEEAEVAEEERWWAVLRERAADGENEP